MHRKYLIHPLKAAIYVFALYQNSKFCSKSVNLYICIACCTFAPLISCSFLSINTKQTFKYTIFLKLVTCYASFHQLYLFTILLYETVPPKRIEGASYRKVKLSAAQTPKPFQIVFRTDSSGVCNRNFSPLPKHMYKLFFHSRSFSLYINAVDQKAHHNKKIIPQEQRRSNVDSYIFANDL